MTTRSDHLRSFWSLPSRPLLATSIFSNQIERAARKIGCALRRLSEARKIQNSPVHGLLSAASGSKKMQKHDLTNIEFLGSCQTRSLASWADEISCATSEYFRLRPLFISDVGYTLMKMREATGLNRSQLSRTSGLSRVTILEMESGTSMEGNSIAKVCQYLRAVDGKILIACEYLDRGTIVPLVISFEDDPAALSATVVRRLRTAASLSQRQLSDRLRLPGLVLENAKTSDSASPQSTDAAPMISRIEGAHQTRGIRLGTLFSVAFFCGFRLSVPVAPKVVQ